ncbi:cytochrome P450 [Hypoxylon sp. FL1150]|nr:cytochrome P450 [Hypoxylon sp. FL1150]
MNVSLDPLETCQNGTQWALQSPLSFLFAAAVIVVLTYTWISSTNAIKGLPEINPTGFFSSVAAKKFFTASGLSLITQARRLYPGQAFRVMTQMGERVILPYELIEEVRNQRRLHFGSALVDDGTFMGIVPGFQPLSILNRDNIFQAVTIRHLTKVPAAMSRSLCDEADFIIPKVIGDSSDWHEMALSPAIHEITTKVATRVFLGKEFCRNDDWIRVTEGYTHSWAMGSSELHLWPRPLLMLVQYALPWCKSAIAQATEARQMLAPVIAERQRMIQAAVAAGQEVPKFDDAIEWLGEEAARRGLVCDAAMVGDFQLVLTMVAIHTTSDLLQQFIVDLAQHPETLQQIRHEVVKQLQAGGLTKESLHKMPLLDSAIKETQRLKPIQFLLLRRRAQEDIQFSNGLYLKKGTRTWIDTSRMRDPAAYENPEEWDATRFLKLRSQPGRTNEAYLVSPGPDHFGFGYGIHACPGRFFAAHELKVIVCHLLVKYEWKLAPETDVKPFYLGETSLANPGTKMLFKRREEVEYDFSPMGM